MDDGLRSRPAGAKKVDLVQDLGDPLGFGALLDQPRYHGSCKLGIGAVVGERDFTPWLNDANRATATRASPASCSEFNGPMPSCAVKAAVLHTSFKSDNAGLSGVMSDEWLK